MAEEMGCQAPPQQCLLSPLQQQSRDRREVHQEDAAGLSGDIDTDKFLRAVLQYRNIPHQDCKKSPAQMVFGRALRDHIPALPYKYAASADWCVSQELRERLLAKSREEDGEKLARNTKQLAELPVGTHVVIQNQTGRHPTKWDKTGVIVEVRPHSQLVIKVDGSRRLTLRNRRFVRELHPGKTTLEEQLPKLNTELPQPKQKKQITTKSPTQSPAQIPTRSLPSPDTTPTRSPPSSRSLPQSTARHEGLQGVQDEVQQHGGYHRQPLSACPPSGGTLTDILEWSIPQQSQQEPDDARDKVDGREAVRGPDDGGVVCQDQVNDEEAVRDQVGGDDAVQGPVGDEGIQRKRPTRQKRQNVRYSKEEYDLSSVRTRSRRQIRRMQVRKAT